LIVLLVTKAQYITTLLGEKSEAFIFEPLYLADSVFKHRFYQFEELLGDSPDILQILYLFPQGNTVAIAPTTAQRIETYLQQERGLVQEPDEEWNTPYPTRDIKTYEFPDNYWNTPYPMSKRDYQIPLIWLNPKSIR